MTLFVTLTVATSCFLSELALSQFMSALLGGTLFRYATTIGIYLSAMGMGTLLQRIEKNPAKTFVSIEIMLAFFGLITLPFLVTWDGWATGFFAGALPWIAYGLVAITGYLVGREVPLLAQMGSASSQILAVDFLGTFLGALIFYFWMRSGATLFLLVWTCALMNALMALFVERSMKTEASSFRRVRILGVLFGAALCVFAEPTFTRVLVEKFYLR